MRRKDVYVYLVFLCFTNCNEMEGNDEKQASMGDEKQKMAFVRDELKIPKYASAFLFVRHFVLLSLFLSHFLSI